MLMKKSGKLVAAWTAGACLVGLSQASFAQERSAGPTWAEFQKLQTEMRDQRALIIQLMQSEQQRYDMLLKLLQTGGSLSPERAAAAAPPAIGATTQPRGSAATADPATRVRDAVQAHATVEGTVRVTGGEADAVYVYVDNLRGAAVKGKQVQIKQEGKQFNPTHAVVQVGTALWFPNEDSIFHNVFSQSPRNSFDLGAFRAGPPPKPVIMTSPGVVDVQCNMHESMRAAVLVVPNKLFAKVRPDGTFRIEGVPTGPRRLVAWGPNLKPARQMVDLGAGGARADFSLEYTGVKVLPNKLGQPYGSYKE
jgi:plastocyanin